MLSRNVEKRLKNSGDSLIINAFKEFDDVDFIAGNLECVFTQSNKNIQNRIFNFKADPRYASVLKKAGVNIVNVASNHSTDFGTEGFKNTIKVLNINNINIIGNDIKPLIISKNNYKVALLSTNLTAFNDSLPINSPEKLCQCITNFKSAEKTTPLIVYIHFGTEGRSYPDGKQREIIRQIVCSGADAIIGSHPHTVQNIEYINSTPVFYSLGNYIFDVDDYCYAVKLTMDKQGIRYSLMPMKIKNCFPKKTDIKESCDFFKKALINSSIALKYKNGEFEVFDNRNCDFEDIEKYAFYACNYKVCYINNISENKGFMISVDDNISSTRPVVFDGKIYQLKICDIDNDSIDEIVLGRIKQTRFSREYLKRVNVYDIENDRLKPFWLGSKFNGDLINFDIEKISGLNYLKLSVKYDKSIKTEYYLRDGFGFVKKEIKNNNNL